MSIEVIEGQKNEIAEKIAKISGRVIRAIVVVEDPAPAGNGSAQGAPHRDVEKILAELDKDTVAVGDADDSREAIYTRLEGE